MGHFVSRELTHSVSRSWSVLDDNDFFKSNKQSIESYSTTVSWQNKTSDNVNEKNLENFYNKLELPKTPASSVDIPKDLLKSAAEMIVFLNFRPSKSIIFWLKFIQRKDLQVKQFIMGTKVFRCNSISRLHWGY